MTDELTPKELGRIRKIEINNFTSRFPETSLETYRRVTKDQREAPLWRAEWSECEVAFRLTADDAEILKVFSYLDLDPKSPISWRIVVELFAKEAFQLRGRPSASTPESLIRMAQDFNEIRLHLFNGNWNVAKVAVTLKTKAPYKDRYDYHEGHLRKLIRNVIAQVGPIDDDLMVRLIEKYGDDFFWDIEFKRTGQSEMVRQHR